MQCVVTGAAGFIGSHLCERLLALGHEVVGLDAFVPYYPRGVKERNLAGLTDRPRFRFHRLDLRSDPLDAVVADAEAVFHLAAMPGLVKSWTDFDGYNSCNVTATQRLLDALRAAPRLRRLVHVSTSSVYGRFAAGDETLPTKPVSPYGVTKLAAEHLCQAYADAYGLPVVILRFFSVYGPRQRPDMGYHRFLDALLHDRPITIYGDGRQERGATYVADAVEAAVLAPDALPGEIFNVGGGETASVLDVLRLMEQITGLRFRTRHEAARPGDQQHTAADTGKLRRLGWKPGTRLADGLARQWAWQRMEAAAASSPAGSTRPAGGSVAIQRPPPPLEPAPMPTLESPAAPRTVSVRVHHGPDLAAQLPRLRAFALAGAPAPLSRDPAWLSVLERAFGHEIYALEAVDGERTCGFLPLAFVRSLLFGRFLISLPYLNTNGVVADDDETRGRLIDRAVRLADELRVRYLELRHERKVEHPALTGALASKCHMRLELPEFPGPLWEGLPAKVRNQVRKGEKSGLTTVRGGEALLPEFYSVFSRNMRDLGTPVYGRGLFAAALRQFPADAELVVVRAELTPVAAALLLHGPGVTEVPSASSLRQYNHTCANMLLYWKLLERAIERGQAVFDFGRSTIDGNTYRFKKQWGAKPAPAAWQYYRPGGDAPGDNDPRPENPRYQRLIRIWRQLPVSLTRWIGPSIVRGIP